VLWSLLRLPKARNRTPVRWTPSSRISSLTWEKTNPELGNNSPEVTILHVNSNTKASELLIRTPKNFHVPKHWHTANETLTVIRGTFIMAHEGGDNKVELNVGSYGYMPAKMIQ
jgi:quercetin dioxygenase-like cupin family protein